MDLETGVVIEITSAEQYHQLVTNSESNKLVIVQFTASFCNPCKKFKPKLDQLAKDNSVDVTFVSVNVEELEKVLVKECEEIIMFPTYKFFKNGKEFLQMRGLDELTLRLNILKFK